MQGEPQTSPQVGHIKRIGFVATRIAGCDGVSLEVHKWAAVLKHMGYECFFIAGKLEEELENKFLVREAFFQHPEIEEIQKRVLGETRRSRELTKKIHASRDRIKRELYKAHKKFDLDLIIAENALAMPMNIPLGLALTEFLAESGIPCIGHHHDFFWERERFSNNAVSDYLHTAFPPRLPNVKHVVINSVAEAQLSYRLGVSSTLIPNVMDFAHPPIEPDMFARCFRSDIGLRESDWLVLQPARVVARKKIELAIELVKRLAEPRAQLIITHGSRDEGDEYTKHVKYFAWMLDVPVKIVSDWVGQVRSPFAKEVGHRQYSIQDTYPSADLVTYPSEYEGFGNAFLEAVYHCKPIVCNRYSIYRTDIEPKGFNVISMDGYVSDETVERTRAVLEDRQFRQQMVERNYQLALQFFSYAVLEKKLQALLAEIVGVPRLSLPPYMLASVSRTAVR